MSTGEDGDGRVVGRRVAPWAGLDTLRCDFPASEVLDRLKTASRRGRLPGYREVQGGFAVELFGVPWDRELVGLVGEGAGGGSSVSWRRRDRRGMQALWAVVLLLSVWPGVLLADTFIPSGWGWFGTHVWHWYVPLTALSNAWAWWWAVKRTEATTSASAREAGALVARELAAKEPASPARAAAQSS